MNFEQNDSYDQKMLLLKYSKVYIIFFSSLDYEAYIPMANKKLKELCNRLRVKWPVLHHIAIYHRLGTVGPCEASVIIGIY